MTMLSLCYSITAMSTTMMKIQPRPKLSRFNAVSRFLEENSSIAVTSMRPEGSESTAVDFFDNFGKLRRIPFHHLVRRFQRTFPKR